VYIGGILQASASKDDIDVFDPADDGAADIEYTPAGTGAVATTVQAKLREPPQSTRDKGCLGDGVTDDTAAFSAMITNAAAGSTIIIKGLVRLTAKVTCTKRLNFICPSSEDALLLDVGAANDGFEIKGGAAGINNIELFLNVYGRANACKNAVVLERVDRCTRGKITVRAGAAEYAVSLRGCLINNWQIDNTVNYAPPISSPGMSVDHIYMGTDTQSLSVYTNANNLWVNLEGARNGVVSADLNSQGDNCIDGTIEGLSGKPFDITGAFGMQLGGTVLHLEANAVDGLLTNCKQTIIGNVGNNNGGIDIVGCRSTVFANYTGSYDIDSASVGTRFLNVYNTSTHTQTDASTSAEAVGGSSATASSALVMLGLAGRNTQENFFHNPYLDIWTNGAASAPDGVTLTNCTAAKDVAVYWDLNPGLASANFTVTGTTINDGPSFTPKAPWQNKGGDRWISILAAIYVPTGQTNVRPYILASGQYLQFAPDVTARDTWVIVRGSVFADGGQGITFAPRIYNGAAFVAGNFRVSGCSIVEGTAAPKNLCDDGKRGEHIVTSVANTPAFLGQRALVGSTWYMAKGVASSADWVALN
jgi:hypothetical protein